MSTSLSNELGAQLQGAPLQQIADRLGLDPAQAQGAVAAALPLLLATLGHNTAQPDGAQALLGALQRDHTPSAGGGIGELLEGVLGGGAQGDGAGILGHVFGGQAAQASAGLGQVTGLDSARSSQLLQLLAPIVLGFLARRFLGGDAGAGDAGQLGQALGQERQQAQADGGVAGLLGSVFDQDGDGQLGVGDLLTLGGGLFGKR
jgi:hypothetical protein